jgi:uncharacterized membrane protein YccC
MSVTDNLRVFRQRAFEARRDHIAQSLGRERLPASTERLPRLQHLIERVNQALALPRAASGTSKDQPERG